MLRHLLNFLLSLLPPSRLFALRRLLLKLAGVEIQRDTCVCGRGWIYGRGQLVIGRGTWVSPGTIFHTHADVVILIGDRCDIGPGVHFIPGGHLIGPAHRRAGPGTAGSIMVGSGTWVGAGTQILGGVKIGEGCIIAAGAVVTRDVPADTLAAGVPAVVKRTLPK